MSNLGSYQTFTTFAKKCGGVIPMLIGTGVSGYAIIRLGEAGCKYIKKYFIKIEDKFIYYFEKPICINKDTIEVNTKFNVIGKYGDNVIIKLTDDENVSYVVSKKSLKECSNYKKSFFVKRRNINDKV